MSVEEVAHNMSLSLREEPIANITSYDIEFVAGIMTRVVELAGVNDSLHVSEYSCRNLIEIFQIRTFVSV